MDTSEKRFEQDIESFLVSPQGGYEQFSYLNPDGHRIHKYYFDKEKGIYPEVFVNFVMRTQPKQWERYVRYYGDAAQEKLYRRLEDSIQEHGLVYVLKNGIRDMGDRHQSDATSSRSRNSIRLLSSCTKATFWA